MECQPVGKNGSRSRLTIGWSSDARVPDPKRQLRLGQFLKRMKNYGLHKYIWTFGGTRCWVDAYLDKNGFVIVLCPIGLLKLFCIWRLLKLQRKHCFGWILVAFHKFQQMRIQVCSANLKHDEHCLHFEKLSIVEDQRWVGDRSCDGAFGKLTTYDFRMFHMFHVTFKKKTSAKETI